MVLGNFIGNTLSFSNGERFKTLNPTNNQCNAIELLEATTEEIQNTCLIAHKAFPKFNKIAPKKRAQLLLHIAQLLNENSSELVQWYQLESGLSEERGKIELQRTIQQLKDFSSEISKKNWEITHSKPESSSNGICLQSLKKIKQGIGPVLVFGASNFPFAYSTIGGDTVAALAAGCPVIVKSHPFHAVLSYKVAELVLKAGEFTEMPNGFFSHLNAFSHEVGRLLVLHPAIKAIGFTGSIKGGLAIRKLSHERPDEIPVFAEMGSLNPVVLFPSSIESKKDIQETASKIAQSITQSSGQFCTKPGVLFLIENDSTREFIFELTNCMQQAPTNSLLHPSITENYNHLRGQIEKTPKVIKATIDSFSTNSNAGHPHLSITDSATFLHYPLLQEEVFGPHCTVICCRTFEELSECITALLGQLTVSIFSKETTTNEFNNLVELALLKAGRIILNSVPTGVQVHAAMQHGGPFPSSSDTRFTAVGTDSIHRFLRNVCLQGFE